MLNSLAKLRQQLPADTIQRGDFADTRTLHISCNNDLMYKLAAAGFEGDFLSLADAYTQGPVPALNNQEGFIRIRATFIRTNNEHNQQQAFAELSNDYQTLENARNYARIAFWFEHDASDALAFVKMLHFFSDPAKRAPLMQCVCVSDYPGAQGFNNGVGSLPAEAMSALWKQFQPLSEEQFAFGKLCWQAYTSATPEAFARVMAVEKPPLPTIIPALQRHIRELPWITNGLSLSEHMTLQILLDHGKQNAASLFYRWYSKVYDPLPFMADNSYWRVLEQLANAPHPAIKLIKISAQKTDWLVSLTEFGQQLLRKQVHWLDKNPYDRWFGGTHNRSDHGIWYWDNTARNIVCTLS